MAYFSMFVKLAALRGDALLSSPSATLAQHLRIVLLLGGILAQDISWIAGYVRTLGDGSWRWAGGRGRQGREGIDKVTWLLAAELWRVLGSSICGTCIFTGLATGMWRSSSTHSPRPRLPSPALPARSHALLWLYDAVFVAVDASLSLVKYATHAVDHARRAAAEARGEVRWRTGGWDDG